MLGVFSRRRGASAPPSPPPEVPAGQRVYAVGDIHGRYDLLRTLLERIEEDAACHPDTERTLVYLGDYIDRGPDSRQVVEHLVTTRPSGLRSVFLMGNHEESLLGFLDDPEAYAGWLSYGGLATLVSYRIDPGPPMAGLPLLDLAEELLARIPGHHLTFLRRLQEAYVLGDYLFVHAGIRPGVPIELQSRQDLLWIRGDFLRSTAPHPKVIVHGHNISEEPEIKANRIGIDTGAYASGCLTCVVLEGRSRSFIDTR